MKHYDENNRSFLSPLLELTTRKQYAMLDSIWIRADDAYIVGEIYTL